MLNNNVQFHQFHFFNHFHTDQNLDIPKMVAFDPESVLCNSEFEFG